MRCSMALTPDAATSAALNEIRARYDAHYGAVVPHVTVAFPDECAGDLTAVQAMAASIVQGVPAFTATFDRWVSVTELLAEHRAGTEFLLARYSNAANLLVLLASQGAAEMLQLRAALSQAIPQPPELLDYPPYTTIGQSLSEQDFIAAKAALKDYRPNYSFVVKHIDFYAEQADGSWPILASLPLA